MALEMRAPYFSEEAFERETEDLLLGVDSLKNSRNALYAFRGGSLSAKIIDLGIK